MPLEMRTTIIYDNTTGDALYYINNKLVTLNHSYLIVTQTGHTHSITDDEWSGIQGSGKQWVTHTRKEVLLENKVSYKCFISVIH